jgi:ferritin-like metal-binding protein YciE
MEKMIDLKDLLKHEIMDLYSAEAQIIDALPAMIDKAKNANLKKALQEHLKITEEQKRRLDKMRQLMNDNKEEEESQETNEEKKGFFSRLFGNGMEKCKGMAGLIDEGQKIMKEDMSPEVSDAAIIASAQKIEHYEISGYGTARAYARDLNLKEVQNLLEETLKEEYEADDRLTQLALKRVNPDAEKAGITEMENRPRNESADERSATSGSSAKKSGSKEHKPGRKENNEVSSTRSEASKKTSSAKANASKSGSSKQKANSRSDNQKTKKSAPKQSQSKAKKGANNKKAKAR